MKKKGKDKKPKANKKAKDGEIKIQPLQQNENHYQDQSEITTDKHTELTRTSFEKQDDNFYEKIKVFDEKMNKYKAEVKKKDENIYTKINAEGKDVILLLQELRGYLPQDISHKD